MSKPSSSALPRNSKHSFAGQIARLLNNYSNLQTNYTGPMLLQSGAHYLPLHHEGTVFASIAVHKQGLFLSEIRHLVVHPLLRGKGIAKQLLKNALEKVETPVIYATIRESNIASIAVFEKFDFKNYTTFQHSGFHIKLYLKIK